MNAEQVREVIKRAHEYGVYVEYIAINGLCFRIIDVAVFLEKTGAANEFELLRMPHNVPYSYTIIDANVADLHKIDYFAYNGYDFCFDFMFRNTFDFAALHDVGMYDYYLKQFELERDRLKLLFSLFVVDLLSGGDGK